LKQYFAYCVNDSPTKTIQRCVRGYNRSLLNPILSYASTKLISADEPL
jgi:hypothetical protein